MLKILATVIFALIFILSTDASALEKGESYFRVPIPQA